ncbi:MAG: ATP-grasp domain-containing protein [Phycisphaerales bacterium]|jgi:carbamoylphosphate synthase large subunit|nr:ATP-grasp domain-containing protein [Phycisphaerales bacterium]MBT7171784.1 ATP-grasp domain-containing protein [Phycisphaerales bacterium]
MPIAIQNLLVFPCGSECGLEINKALKHEKYVNLFGASSVECNHGRFAFEQYIQSLVPMITAEDFIPRFNAILDEYAIGFVVPALDSVALFLTEHRDEINATVISPSYETNAICRSKQRTYDLLADVIAIPASYSAAEVTDAMFPVFLKPDVGQGSQGTVLAKDRATLDYYTGQNSDLLVLDYLPGPEYTIDCFTDRHGKLRFCGGRQRRRTRGGISVNSIRVRDDRFEQWAEKINTAMAFRGAWFYQVKETAAGEFVLLEVATRIAGTSALARNRGVNLPLLSLYDAMDMDVAILENDIDNEIDRALVNRFRIGRDFEHVYVDFDDCLIVAGKVNTDLVAFLYDCIHRSKGVYLLTRHAEDIHASLAKYRLTGLFDEIIHIGLDEPKSGHVTRQPAIFIDDSHKERKDVAEKTATLVFSPDVFL